MSLRTKLIVLLLTALILPVMLTQWQLLEYFSEIQQADQKSHLEHTVESVGDRLLEMERDAQVSARLIASSPGLAQYFQASQSNEPSPGLQEALRQRWQIYVQHNTAINAILCVSVQGELLFRFAVDNGDSSIDMQSTALRKALASGKDTFVQYWPEPDRNLLQILIAQQLPPLVQGYVVVVLAVDAETIRHGQIGAEAAQSRAELWVRDVPVIVTDSAGIQNQSLQQREILQVTRMLDSDLTIKAAERRNSAQWLHPMLVRSTLFSLGIFVIVACLLFLIVNRWLILPLQHALTLTQQIGAGNWLPSNTLQRRDELGNLVQALHDMSERLRQTTSEVENKREQAEQAERLKTEFLANISHEIRTPVNIIVGVMNRLARFITDPRQKTYLDSAVSEAHKLVRQIDGLIELADLESNKHHLQQEEFYIPDLVQRAITPFLSIAQQKQLSFDAHIDDELNEVVIGDSQKIFKVLNVLLDNALKFTDQGGVELTVRLLRLQDDHLLCEFAVQDTGMGIDPKMIPHVGKAFAQEKPASGSHGEGLGLGLAVARGFLALMHSRLVIVSEKGLGSRFSFQLALQRSSQTQMPEQFFI